MRFCACASRASRIASRSSKLPRSSTPPGARWVHWPCRFRTTSSRAGMSPGKSQGLPRPLPAGKTGSSRSPCCWCPPRPALPAQ
eukprot:6540259-Heterocapsa_arctica.AAC.1